MIPKGKDETLKDDEEKEIYFIALKPIEKDQKESIDSKKKLIFISKLEPQNILSREIEIENKSFIKHDGCKMKINENLENIEIEYRIGKIFIKFHLF